MTFVEEFSPTTLTMGFVEGPIHQVARAWEQWLALKGWQYERSACRGIRGALQAFAPLSWPPDKEAFIATQGAWTAYVNNAALYRTEPAPIGELALRCGCRSVEISMIPHAYKAKEKTGVPGLATFVLYGPEMSEWTNVRRSVNLAFDNGWKFTTIGAPLDFENTERYSAKKTRDRFDANEVLRMCEALGIRPYDESFYAPEALVYQYPVISRTRDRAEDWATARRRLGLP